VNVPRYKLIIAYDGTDFCGWQKQEPPAGMEVASGKVLGPVPTGAWDTPPGAAKEALAASGGTRDLKSDSDDARIELRTVQAVVERAVREVVREPIVLHGASRTDAGVHARGQVAAFSCSDSAWPLERGTDPLLRAVNSRLPEDVLVVSAEAVGESFNPISDCTAKGYSYRLHISPHRALWNRRFVHHVWVPLDVMKMNDAAARVVGEHDFAAFAAAGHGRLSTVRTVFECRVTDERGTGIGPETVRIDISGNGFLWNMVRIIAGTLVEVGRGRMTPDSTASAIESKDRRKAGPTLPPTGLCLEWVKYRDADPAAESLR
jgi:tRNA pseudouridine38-40 synthase